MKSKQQTKPADPPAEPKHPNVKVYPVHERDRGRGSRSRNRGAVVERVVHETTGRVAEIRLDKGSMDFSCMIGEDLGTSKDGRALRDWALDCLGVIESDEIPEWLGVLEIHTSGRDRSYRQRGEIDTGLEITARRYWIARTPAGQWKTAKWETGDPKSHAHVPPELRFKEADRFALAEEIERGESDSGYNKRKGGPRAFALPAVDGERTYLAYDEALWTGCKRIAAGLDEALVTLRQMLTTQDGNEAVRALGTGKGTLLLSAGEAK